MLIFQVLFFCLVVIATRGESQPTLNKCCRKEEFFDLKTKSCLNISLVDLEEDILWDLSAYLDHYENFLFENGSLKESGILFPSCDTERYQLKYHTDFFLAPANDSNELSVINDMESISYKTFCIEKGFKRSPVTVKNSTTMSYHFEGLVAVYCSPIEQKDCFLRPCVQICCSPWTIFDPKQNECVDIGDNPILRWKPNLHSKETGKPMSDLELLKRSSLPKNQDGEYPVRVLYGRHKKCEKTIYNQNSNFTILEDGSLNVDDLNFKFNRYCINYYKAENTSEVWSQAEVCNLIENSKFFDFTILPSLFVISIFFLCLLFIHIWRKTKSKLFGSMMLSTIGTLIMFYIFVAVVKFSGREMIRNQPKTCTAKGFLIQYTYLSAFFWLNAMSFDIWVSFRSFKPMSGTQLTYCNQRETHYGCARQRYKYYALYAWGLPLSVVGVTVLIQYLPEDLTLGMILPLVGKKSCLFGGHLPTLLYLHVIAGPVLCANVFFFACFVYNLCWGVWASNDLIARKQQKSRVKAVLKMFFVMGVTWIMDVLTWGLQWAFSGQGLKNFTMACDVINGLQGFIMFCVVYFDRETIKYLRTILTKSRQPARERPGLLSVFSRTTTTTVSSIGIPSRQNTLNDQAVNGDSPLLVHATVENKF